MSSLNTAAVVRVALIAMTLLVSPYLAAAQQPRDPKNDVARPESAREQELKAAAATDPANIGTWLELAILQEKRGAIDLAERSFKSAVSASVGTDSRALTTQAGFYNRQGKFELSVSALEAAAALNPVDPQGHQLVATYYWEKAFKDQSITPADKLKYIDAGIAATDRALAVHATYIEAMTYKNILLRMKAQAEPDAAQRDALIAEADLLRNQALELNKSRGTVAVGSSVPQPPPPPSAPIRVGGNIKTPTKVQHVSPVYPAEAQAAGVSGMVIIEATIDADGNVSNAKVLRSIPLLDDAALAAVKQWRFTPTLLNGAPVPVIMTVTVNFTLQ